MLHPIVGVCSRLLELGELKVLSCFAVSVHQNASSMGVPYFLCLNLIVAQSDAENEIEVCLVRARASSAPKFRKLPKAF